jgi:hypothetical protein
VGKVYSCPNQPSSIVFLQIPYPLINLVTRLPLTIQGNAPLSVQTRIFTSYLFQFTDESDARDVWESVKGLTVVSESHIRRVVWHLLISCASYGNAAIRVLLFSNTTYITFVIY